VVVLDEGGVVIQVQNRDGGIREVFVLELPTLICCKSTNKLFYVLNCGHNT